jgi:hypothetical protein
MKKIIKLLRLAAFFLLALFFGLIVFLLLYYAVLEHRKIREDKILAGKTRPAFVSVPPDKSSLAPALDLLPVPRMVLMKTGTYRFPETVSCSVADSLKPMVAAFLEALPKVRSLFTSGGAGITFQYREGLPDEGYRLDIQPGRIIVDYSTRRGVYYALVTLKVLRKNYAGDIPCATLEDYPDLRIRGVLLDISRDKVPTLETLKGIVTLLADLKYNRFELYVEGFSFAYPSFKHLWEGKETPVTGEEIQELDAFCRARFIELVPNQNAFGHMAPWLATEEFGDLAECPDGYNMLGFLKLKSTLDPSDPRSIELVSRMMDDLLPNFTSNNFNVDLDEPFELGKGKSKELVKEKGVGQVYLDYALKIHELVRARDKHMLMAGDVVLRHPELLSRIPKDITVFDWGYEASYPFEKNCKIIQASGLDYLLFSGTSSWTTITGRTDNMLGNISAAAANAVQYGAGGMVVTDWGDMGHWQYLPVSYAGYVTGGALGWNSRELSAADLSRFLNHYLFRDSTKIMGDLVLDMGRYNRFEEIILPNMTRTMLALQFGLRDRVMADVIFSKILKELFVMMEDLAPEMVDVYKEKLQDVYTFDYSGLYQFLDNQEALLAQASLQIPEGQLIRDEYRNAMRLIRLGAGLQHYINTRHNLQRKEEIVLLQHLQELTRTYLDENKRLWLLRNKSGGYARSSAALESLQDQIEKRLALFDKSFITRGIHRFFEKITAAGAALYFRII